MGLSCSSNENSFGKMPLLGRRRSKEDKERIRRQLNLAKHSPLPAVDLCNCSLRCVPAEAYTIVRHMLKEVLLLHSNRLHTLADERGSHDGFGKMAGVLAVDLHCNELAGLPVEIGRLGQLQELNLSSNFIEQLPESIGNLRRLRKLTVSNNRLRSLPASIGDCCSLQHLDVRQNPHLDRLPSALGRCSKLDELLVDVDRMQTPPKDVCAQGPPAMLTHLRSQPDFVAAKDDQKQQQQQLDARPNATYILDAYYRRLSDTALCQMTVKDSASQLAAASEQNLLERFSQQGRSLAEMSKEQRDQLMKQMSLENEMFASRMDDLCKQKQMDRKELVETVAMLEQTTAGLIELVLSNSTARDEARDELVLNERWFADRWRRHQEVRTDEIQSAMAAILHENAELSKVFGAYQSDRDRAVAEALSAENGSGAAVDNALNERVRFQKEMCERLKCDEKMQKEALLCLMEQRDARTRQMSYQIELIENELKKLSMVERANRKSLEQNYTNGLESQRMELTRLLMELLRERDLRAKQLRQQLDDMERARRDAEVDFWLRRYQTLLDAKPLTISQTECLFDAALVKALNKAGAADYAPNFARHNVTTLDMLARLTEADLQKMGVDNVGARKRLADLAGEHRRNMSFDKLDQKLNTAGMSAEEPSAPQLPPTAAVARFEVECVVCMDRQASVLLAPCGHVCACAQCAGQLRECPLCRTPVTCVVDLPEHELPTGVDE